MVVRLRAVQRIGFPLYRRDIWIHILLTFPLLIYLTYRSWSSWHPEVNLYLSESCGFSLPDQSPAIQSMLDSASKLPIGVPLLFPSSSIPIELQEPLLKSNNKFLVICAAWVCGFVLFTISLLLPSWLSDYKFRVFYNDAPSLKEADTLIITDEQGRSIFCPIKTGSRFAVNKEGQVERRQRLIQGPIVEYKSKTYLISTVRENPGRAAKYQTLGLLKGVVVGGKDSTTTRTTATSSTTTTSELLTDMKGTTTLLGTTLRGTTTTTPPFSSTELCLLPPQYDTRRTFEAYLKSEGLITMTDVNHALKVFGRNVQDIPIPDFSTLFLEHAVQPLFVFQIFSMLLWLLDEYWQYSMMTLGILIMFEGQMVYRRRNDLIQIKAMHSPPIPVLVKRLGKWYRLSSQDLLPGDIFSLHNDGDNTKQSKVRFPVWPGGNKIPKTSYSEDQSIGIPCDALILHGTCVVNEAMLTGESLPQMKDGLSTSISTSCSEEMATIYDMTTKHKVHTLYAGTGLITDRGSDTQALTDQPTSGSGVGVSGVITSGGGGVSERSGSGIITSDGVNTSGIIPGGDVEGSGGAILYCLRTGFQTTQGKLIRTVLHSSERNTGSSREALIFLIILTVIAVVASLYVLFESWGAPNRNHYKLLLHCVMIITSVVPPELPVTMSLTVTTSVNALFKKKLYCTEPFRIPLAGKLTYCCFDKTGTLTTSDVLLEQIRHGKDGLNQTILVPANSGPNTGGGTTTTSGGGGSVSGASTTSGSKSTTTTTTTGPVKGVLDPAQALKMMEIGTIIVMGCCNALIAIKKISRLPAHMRVADGKKVEDEFQIVGDPLEKTAAAFVGWQPEIGRQDRFIESSGRRYCEVLKRFPFQSELQRMTCVVTLQQERANPRHFVICKGAPEKIASLSKAVPESFSEEVNELALQGRRVLAMAYKEIPNQAELQSILKSRQQIESNLNFAGLLIYGCPIKYKTLETIKILKDSGHATVMITGDDYRTAAHIAKEVGMIEFNTKMWRIETDTEIQNDQISICPLSGNSTAHVCANDALAINVNRIHDFLANKANGLVIVGRDLERLPASIKSTLIPLCNVFARVTPAQKEMILRELKALGEATLMCGDGTNDVGALKAADVGVSLLNFDLEKIKERKKEKSVKRTNDEDKCRAIVLDPPSVSRPRRLALGLNSRQIQQLEAMEANFVKQRRQLEVLPLWWKNRTIPAFYQNIVNAEERMAQNNLAMASGGNTSAPNKPIGGFLASLMNQGSTNVDANPLSAASGLEDFDDGQPLLRPGDASMASPFTYRGQSIKCVKLLIRMGKATLATVMMNYRLMALNSLTSAFSLSVLTLNGVKYGDAQVTAEALFVTVLYMCVGNAAQAKTITRDRVVDSLFDPHFYVSIILQSAVHIITCAAAWKLAAAYDPDASKMMMDGQFKPNLVNTAIFLINTVQHASTFIGNYEGAPFLKSWRDFKILNRTLVAFIAGIFFVAFEISPTLNDKLKLAPMPPKFHSWLIVLMLIDLIGASGVGLLSTRWGRLKQTKLRARI